MWKKFIVFSASIIFFLSPSSAVFAASSLEAYSQISKDLEVMNSYVDTLNDETTTGEAVLTKAKTASPYLRSSSVLYSSVEDTSTTIVGYYRTLSDACLTMASSMDAMTQAINTGDQSLYSSSLTQYNEGLASYNATIKLISSNLTSSNGDSTDYGALLGWALFISSIISIIFFLQSVIGNKLFKAEVLRNQHQKALFLSTLFPFGGSLITFVWYRLTPPGGTYYVLWGPVLFGYIAFIRHLYEYVTKHRPEINKLKKQELHALQSLISDMNDREGE